MATQIHTISLAQATAFRRVAVSGCVFIVLDTDGPFGVSFGIDAPVVELRARGDRLKTARAVGELYITVSPDQVVPEGTATLLVSDDLDGDLAGLGGGAINPLNFNAAFAQPLIGNPGTWLRFHNNGGRKAARVRALSWTVAAGGATVKLAVIRANILGAIPSTPGAFVAGALAGSGIAEGDSEFGVTPYTINASPTDFGFSGIGIVQLAGITAVGQTERILTDIYVPSNGLLELVPCVIQSATQLRVQSVASTYAVGLEWEEA